MANKEHLEVLIQGTDVWNAWREQHPEIYPDLSEADLSEADLSFANLSKVNLYSTDLNLANLSHADLTGATLSHARLIEATIRKTTFNHADLTKAELTGANLDGATLLQANLSRADLAEATLYKADLTRATLSHAHLSRAFLSRAFLSHADLTEANLSHANLSHANLSRATLRNAILIEADLSEANLSEADLSRAKLRRATLVGTNLTEATLTECHIYGISAWNVELTGALQDSLVITPPDEPIITVDNLKIAQFIYLLLNNQEIRDVIDTIARKAVLILGCFTPERKAVLDTLRVELRRRGYLPILFDFEKSSSRNLTETVRTLAHLSRFIVADLTNPSSILQELSAIAPTLAIPIQPVLETSKREYSMFSDLSRTYHWILPIYRYTDLDTLLASLQQQIIDPAEQKAQELLKQKARELTQQ